MKALSSILVLFIVLSITSYAQLQGNCTIGGDEADYESLADAIIYLNAEGISLALLLNIFLILLYRYYNVNYIHIQQRKP